MKTKFLLLLLVLVVVQIANAQTKYLWATASTGGPNGWGTILQADSDGSNFHVVYAFDSTNGSSPRGGMGVDANGVLYGSTSTGGYGDSCVIYTYDPTTGTYTKIYDDELTPLSGVVPVGGLTAYPTNILYGAATSGGMNGLGVIFSINPATMAYADVYDFSDSTGSYPFSEFLLASDGKLYATTTSGGLNGAGVIYSFDPHNNTYSVIHNFFMPDGGCDSMNSTVFYPNMANLMQAADGKLYGTTPAGGAYNGGVIYSLDLAGNIYTDVYDFDTTYVQIGGLVQAGNGKLYGISIPNPYTSVTVFGDIYSFDPSTNSFNVVMSFDQLSGFGSMGQLTKISNGKLLGTNQSGGLNGYGTIFSYDVTTSTYSKLLDFDGANTGSDPSCAIVESSVAAQTATGTTKVPVTGGLSIFPNPTTNVLIVANATAGTPLTITDITGDVIAKYTTSNNTTPIDVSRLAAGTYFLNKVKFVKQ